MSKLIDEPPLLVIPSLATILGLNQAICLQQLHYHLVYQAKDAATLDEWYSASMANWEYDFPWWSKATIKRTFQQLREAGIVEVEKPEGWNRRNSYRINYEALEALTIEADGVKVTRLHRSKSANASGQDDPVQGVKVIRSKGSDRPDDLHIESKERGERVRAGTGQNERLDAGLGADGAAASCLTDVMGVLKPAALKRGIGSISDDAIAKVINAYPDRHHLEEANSLAFWMTDGNGKDRTIKNVPSVYRNWLKRADPKPGRLDNWGQERPDYDRRGAHHVPHDGTNSN